MIVLTSFEYMDDFQSGLRFSTALWNPKGIHLETLEFLTPIGADGKEIHLKDFKNPEQEYVDEYRKGIAKRWKWVSTWLYGLDPLRDVVLVCWCPHSKSSREEIARSGFFCCHTGLIGRIVRKHRPDIDVVLDADRETKLRPSWRPE